ncbi:MAG: HNH endonuclease [Paracoccaceae bacterium]
MSGYLADAGVDVTQRRSAWETLSNMNDAYGELAIDVGLAAGGAIPMVGWGADAIALGRSWSSGTWTDVMFDLAGFVPALGDTAKGARVVAKLDDLRRTLDIANTAMGRMFQSTKEAAAKYWDDVMASRKAAYDEAVRACGTNKACRDSKAPMKGPQYAQTPTTNGNWVGERGDGVWHPDGGGPPITYRNGFPDFSAHSRGQVEIPMTGLRGDHAMADSAMRNQLGDQNWTRPPGYTWHHKEDGVTMQLVPTSINNTYGHTGGASLYSGANSGGF